MRELMSLADAIAKTEGGKPHVLLGNGFSIGAHEKFRYQSLYESAKSELSERITALFDRYGTSNFEDVLRQLDDGKWLTEHYKIGTEEAWGELSIDYEQVRDALTDAISRSHPDLPEDVGDEALDACADFLVKFNNVFTLNYDLLLYWASLRKVPFPFKDGFGREGNTPDSHLVFLQAQTKGNFIYFLHGALHLTTADGEVRKLASNRTGPRLMEQILGNIRKKQYPLVVSEGKTDDKQMRIESSSYLSWAFRYFETISGHLFTYGWGLSDQDEHLRQAIVRNTSLGSLSVGVYGDPQSEPNRLMMARAKHLVDRRAKVIAGRRQGRMGGRRGQKNLALEFFNASTARAWGSS